MKKFTSLVRSMPKRIVAVTAIAVASIVVPATLFAWGPSNRPTFTMANPAQYVTFNSITDNPKFGDERNFVQIRNYTDNGTFGENTELVPGKEYEVFAYYHNNAATRLNSAEYNYKGVAVDAFMRTEMPATVAAGQSARVTSYIGASNANPAQVWDEAYGKNNTAATVALRYVPNTATITSEGAVNGAKMPDTLFTTGAPLGYDALNGKLPGCAEFSGYVIYRFKVDQANFSVQKQVSVADKNQYTEEITVNADDTVDYKIKYKNEGTTQQDNVVIKDALPAGVSYVAGSTMISNSKTNNQWAAFSGDTITSTGINIGSYAPGAAAYIKFKAKITSADKLEKCGINTLTNTASAHTQNGTKSDTAVVKVNKECQEPPKKDIEVCLIDEKKIITIKEDEFDESKHSKDLNDCKEAPKKIEVCVVKDKTIVTIDEKDFDNSKHSKNLDDCKETPVTPTTPTTPTELPETGVAGVVASVIGAGSLTTATGYYVASRRALRS